MMMVALVAMMALAASAQQRMNREQMQQMMAERTEKQAERLAKDFDLKGEQKEQFVTLYKEYSAAVSNRDNWERRPQNAQTNSKNMTDEEATAKFEEQMQQQEKQIEQMQQRLQATRDYYVKMKELLTPQQLYKVFAPQQRQGQGQGQRGGQGFGGQRPGGFGGGQRPMGGHDSGFGGDF